MEKSGRCVLRLGTVFGGEFKGNPKGNLTLCWGILNLLKYPEVLAWRFGVTKSFDAKLSETDCASTKSANRRHLDTNHLGKFQRVATSAKVKVLTDVFGSYVVM